MPKDSSNRHHYYDYDMSGRGESGGRGYRSKTSNPEQRDHKARGAPQYGSPSGVPSRRPGQPSSQPSSSHSSSPYARPSTSQPSAGSYSSAAYGQSVKEFSETGSDTASYAGSTAEDSTSMGRGALRGKRVLPMDIITRPRELKTKKGGTGTRVDLEANYFKLLSTTDWCLYQYRIDFSPEEDRTVVRKGLLRHHRETLGAYIFDGTILFTSHKLTEPLELHSERMEDKQDMLITVRHVGSMIRGDYHYIQFFNIIMRKCLDFLKLRLVGRNYFDAENKAQVAEFRLELWPGYVTSIRQHEHDILMCAEITHKVLRTDTLLNCLSLIYESNPNNYQNVFKQQVLGSVVLTDYNNNTYRVDDVDFSVTPNSTFKKRNGEEISYCDYYRTKYQIHIHNLQQPLIVSKSKPRDRRAGKAELVYLIPELCRSTGLTDAMRNDYRLMSALAKHTRVSPSDRIKKLMTFNRRLHNEQNVIDEFTSWNLKLDTRLIRLQGRILPNEKIVYGNSVENIVGDNANWTSAFRNCSLKQCGKLNEWFVVVPGKLKQPCQSFITTLIHVASKMNFKIEPPNIVDIRDDSPSTYVNILENIQSKSNPMLIFCVVSNNRVDRYSAIKKKCCVDRPVPTQVMLSKNICSKQPLSIATKVAIQMNCKIGGIPWSISIPLTGLMVVGFDVCHDTNSKERDFGAMVASLDPHYGRYYSAVSSHKSGEELSNDLSVNLCKALSQFKHYNGGLPKKIVVYRDGVGEGQIPFVVNHEVQHIKSKLEGVYGSPEDLKMAYIIVTKKINTRIFLNAANPGPGTVVDDVITDPTKYDFLLVSQHVGQGTVSPTSYNIISDTSTLDADKIQRLTYKLCHLYFNWSGTVRVPAPCQYAHKLAFLVSQAVHQAPNTALETLLYFL